MRDFGAAIGETTELVDTAAEGRAEAEAMGTASSPSTPSEAAGG